MDQIIVTTTIRERSSLPKSQLQFFLKNSSFHWTTVSELVPKSVLQYSQELTSSIIDVTSIVLVWYKISYPSAKRIDKMAAVETSNDRQTILVYFRTGSYYLRVDEPVHSINCLKQISRSILLRVH